MRSTAHPPTKPPHHRGGFSTFPPGGSGSLSLTLIHSLMFILLLLSLSAPLVRLREVGAARGSSVKAHALKVLVPCAGGAALSHGRPPCPCERYIPGNAYNGTFPLHFLLLQVEFQIRKHCIFGMARNGQSGQSISRASPPQHRRLALL